MPTPDQILQFDTTPPPPGASPFIAGAPEPRPIEILEYDPAWPLLAAEVIDRLRAALGMRALRIDHVGSTSVPRLPAKPVIDIDVTLADTADEPGWLPLLENAGFTLTIREPWWCGHRLVKADAPDANVHLFGPESPEQWRHTIFRDWLRSDAADRELYARTKREAAGAATAAGELVMDYNQRKQQVIREIYGRAFRAAGLTS